MKKFFTKIKDWFKRHKPTKRRLIQVYAALLYNANIKGYIAGDIYKGATKYACVPGLNCYSCPGAVGACPLGALQNALYASNTTAPFYMLGIILLFGLILGRTVCGFLCPVGLGQELLYKIKTPKLKKSKYTRIFSYFKYVVLVALVVIIPIMFSLGSEAAVPAFCKYICPAGTFGGGVGLMLNGDWVYASLGSLFTWKFALLVAICIASVFIFRFFCRFFCPLGAIYGFFSKIALLGVKLDQNKCTDCGLCLDACKMDIKHVGDHECVHCGDCISVCPAKAISWKGSKLFVHANAVDTGAPVAEKPLGGLLGGENAAQEVAASTLTEAVAVENATVENELAVSSETTAEGNEAVRREKKRNFWLQFAAWAAALALLIGAIVYYNFIDVKKDPVVGNQVGDICPDFTVSRYMEDGEYSVTDTRGKITVLNFWATWCGPCVAELPFFNDLQKAYPDEVAIIAIHESVTRDVEEYIRSRGWESFELLFVQDTITNGIGEVYSMLASGSALPETIILDRDGIIAYDFPQSMTYELLLEKVQSLL